MNRANKEKFVAEFRDRVEAAPAVYLTDFRGLDVKSMTVLRETLRESGAELLVVKNRLALRAIDGLGIPDLSPAFEGPTGVILVQDGPVEPAKALSDFQKAHGDRPIMKLGFFDDQLVEAEGFERLAKLPPRDVLYAMLAGALESPLQALAGALQAKVQEFVGLLEALRAKADG
jgi:large subunit ribosomal protein L10